MSYLSTNTSASYATASASKRVSGLMSGLDTDEIVKQMTIGLQSKIDSQLQKKQVASWQQEAFRTITKAINEFQTKYFKSTTSSNSILSPNFFNSTAIANSSPYLNISGAANAARNMQVQNITQLAKQASFSSSHTVSNNQITSGKIENSWVKSGITNSSLTFTYEGKDYTLNIGRDGQTKTLAEVETQIQTQLKDLGLEGKVEFVGGKFTTADVTIKKGSEALLNGLGLKAGDTGEALSAAETNESYFENHSIAAGSKLEFEINGEKHTLTLTSSISLSVDGDIANDSKKIQTALTDMIRANSGLKDKLTVSVTNDGSITFSAKSGSVAVTGGSRNLMDGLKLQADGTGTMAQDGKTSAVLSTTYLDDALAGSTITFDLNGLSKAISFDESERSQFDTPEKLQVYLQNKLNSAYGSNKVNVNLNTDGKLEFTTVNSSGGKSTDVLTVQSSSKTGVLGMDGAFKMYAGESNRINQNKTLRDLQANLSTELSEPTNGEYKISVNGKEFTFKATESLDSIIKKINNDADANVTISYSSTLNTFSAVAKNGGASSKVDIEDVSGNLTQALFGEITDRNIQTGQDAELSVSFDNGSTFNTITRSSNKFTLDGVEFDLKKATHIPKIDENGQPILAPVDEKWDGNITFQVENKTDDLMEKITKFVEDYNNVLTLVNDMLYQAKPTDGKYPPLTEAQKADMSETEIKNWEEKAKKGLLLNDSLLSNFSQEWQRAMTNQVSSITTALYEIGINSTSYKDRGKLTIDEDKLKDALTNDPDRITALFTSTDGIAARLQSTMTKYTNDSLVDTGLFITKAGSASNAVDQSELAKSMKDYDTQVKALKVRLSSQQELYYNQFTALEKYISQMNMQASFFTQNTSSY